MKKTEKYPDPDRLRVLILEDNPVDAELVERELRRAKIIFTSRPVEGKNEFSKALAEFQPQVILSDFSLPNFDGLAALEVARTQAPDIPFIFVSGSIGEEKAIDLLSQGASDYIFKDNLQRLGPAVNRVIETARLKLEKKKTDEELQRHVKELRLLSEASDHFVQINDLNKMYDYLAAVISDISGADYLMLSLYDEKLQAVQSKIVIGFEPFRETIQRRFNIDLLQMVFYLKDMRPDEFSDFISRRLVTVREGLYGLANRQIPRSICRPIEILLAVTSTHSMGFSWENQLYGGLTVFFKKDNDLKNASQVEALVNLAAVAIKRLLAEKSLRESEEKYRLIAENTAETISVLDLDLRYTYISPSIFKLRGFTVEEALKQTVEETLTRDSFARIRDVFREEMALEMSGTADPKRNRSLELQEFCKDGSIVWVENSLSFLRDAQGKAIGFLAVAKDISERKQAEEELLESKALVEAVVENVPFMIFLKEATDLRFVIFNRAGEELLGYERKSLLGKNNLDLFPPEQAAQFMTKDREVLDAESGILDIPEELILTAKQGTRILHTRKVCIRGNDGVSKYLLGISEDITERKRAEELVRNSLKEKEVLLQEIHHRVKNNLQIISGLLTLQADQSAGKTLDEIFSASQDRIRSIALVHEKLYRSHNLAEIAFDEYLRALTENLFISLGIVAGRITVSYEMEPIFFSIEKAIPLGLIVNELVTNALKHAFPAGQQGEIRIGLHGYKSAKSYALKTDSGTLHIVPTCELVIADTGIGLPAGFKADTQKSLGMHLVSMLAQQLQAEFKAKTGPGTEFRLIFSGQPASAVGKDKDHDS